ncbi:hypothetical protein [Streptomyces sp. AC550_RSS872]|uniref:hypothetical protein n=1 Tax=Streptomyces sp. AC550_RSS872 TaxID=2823689 RepID=UPI001C25F33A|nr:hypothetical protein [Streptomyces sp. AC550_RSS872]
MIVGVCGASGRYGPFEIRQVQHVARSAGAAVASAAVERAMARPGARSVVVPPGLPENVVPEEPWFRLEDSRR